MSGFLFFLYYINMYSTSTVWIPHLKKCGLFVSPWGRICLEKLVVASSIWEFPWFFAVFRRVGYLHNKSINQPILSQVNWVLCPPVSLGSISYINFAKLHLYLYCEWTASCISSCHKPVEICTHRKVNFSCLCLNYCVVNKKAWTPWKFPWDLFKHLGGMFWFIACLYLLI